MRSSHLFPMTFAFQPTVDKRLFTAKDHHPRDLRWSHGWRRGDGDGGPFGLIRV